jgi:hypothetical protein
LLFNGERKGLAFGSELKKTGFMVLVVMGNFKLLLGEGLNVVRYFILGVEKLFLQVIHCSINLVLETLLVDILLDLVDTLHQLRLDIDDLFRPRDFLVVLRYPYHFVLESLDCLMESLQFLPFLAALPMQFLQLNLSLQLMPQPFMVLPRLNQGSRVPSQSL